MDRWPLCLAYSCWPFGALFAKVGAMQTQHLSANSDTIQHAAQIIQAGGLVAFPTETVYGLGANAYNPEAVAKIFTAKGRPASDPLIVHIHHLDQLPDIAATISALAYTLAEHFWPGPLTLVLPKTARIPASVSANLATVAVRMPAHPVALALLQAANLPICAPSANLFTRPSPTTAAHVLEDLEGRIDCVLDGGPTSIGLESTILDLTSPTPLILRPGGLSVEQLQAVIPEVQLNLRYVDHKQEGEVVQAPGMLLKHYSPRARVEVLAGPTEAVQAEIQRRADLYHQEGQRVGLMLPHQDLQRFAESPYLQADLGQTEQEVAARLFDALRQLDQQGAEVILTTTLPQEGLGMAIGDRLLRAAEGKIIHVASPLPLFIQ